MPTATVRRVQAWVWHQRSPIKAAATRGQAPDPWELSLSLTSAPCELDFKSGTSPCKECNAAPFTLPLLVAFRNLLPAPKPVAPGLLLPIAAAKLPAAVFPCVAPKPSSSTLVLARPGRAEPVMVQRWGWALDSDSSTCSLRQYRSVSH